MVRRLKDYIPQPVRFGIWKDGKLIAYAVRFHGWTVIQDVIDGDPQEPRVLSCSCLGDFLESKGLDEASVEWLDGNNKNGTIRVPART